MNSQVTASGQKNTRALIDQGFRRLKRCRHGWMLYLTMDDYVGKSLDLYGEFSEFETKLFKQLVRPGQMVLEVGANIGAHTISLAKFLGGRGMLLAFEPQPVIHQILCANVALNNLNNVRVVHSAVGAERGSITLPKIDYHRRGNFGGVEMAQAEQPGEKIIKQTIDSLNLPSCHFIKADVEGMERDVLEGAERTIKKYRPIMFIENDRVEHSKGLITKLFDLDYVAYWHFAPMFNPDNFFKNDENVFGKIISINLLCLPAEKEQQVKGLKQVENATEWWKKSHKDE